MAISEEIKNFFREKTTYDVRALLSSKTEAQIFSMYERIKDCLKTYPREIFNYINEHRELNIFYTEEELRSMTYNELVNLKKALGIKRKKVTKVESVKDEAQMALSILKSATTRDIAARIILTSSEEEENEHDLEYIPLDSLPEEFKNMTFQELANHGFVTDPRIEEPNKEDRYDMIDDIENADVTISGINLNFDTLLNFGPEELNSLHKAIKICQKTIEDQKRLKK